MRALASLLLLLALALAGCASNDAGTPSATSSSSASLPVLGPGTYHIVASGVPATVTAGSEFVINVTVHGDPGRSSDHIGAHFGENMTSSPTTAIYNVTCIHDHGPLPGEYKATCKAPMKVGVYHLRGHARIIEGTQTYNWWGDDIAFTVA